MTQRFEMPETDAQGRPFTRDSWLASLRSLRHDLISQRRREAHLSRSNGIDRQITRIDAQIAAAEAQH